MSDEDEDFPRDVEKARDPFARPSDLPPPEDDPEPSDLGALAAGSRPSSPKGLQAVAVARHDDARLDIGALTRESQQAREAEPEPEPVVRPSARPQAFVAAKEPEVEWSPRRSAFPAWSGPLAVGFALGLGAGAVLFRTATPALPPPAAISTPAPVPAPVAMIAPAAVPAPTVEAASAPPAAPATAVEPGASPVAEPSAARERTEHEYAAAEPSPRPSIAAGEPVPGPDPALTVTPSAEPDQARPAPVAPVAAPAGPARNMDLLLDEALSEPARQNELKLQRQAAETQGALPMTPSREQVEAAVALLRPAIRGCAMGQSGLATADVVVRPDGSVAAVHISGAPFAGAASGRCMEGVVRHAKFPRFRKPSFQFRYPFAIQ